MSHAALRGIISAPILPMYDGGEIDWQTLRSYIAWIAGQKPAAIAMNMDASEGPSLSREEQLEVVKVCKATINGACPLFSGLIAVSTADAVRWAATLKSAGADGLAVFPPMPTFLGKPVPDEMIFQYHKAIADNVDISLIVFQFPAAWGPDFSPDVLQRLVALPQIAGMKEDSFDAVRTTVAIDAVRRLPRKIGLMTGSDTFIFEAMVMGCDGALIGFAATAVRELVEMQLAVEEHRYDVARSLWDRLGPLARYCWREPLRDYRPRMKEVLVNQGIIPRAAVRAPQLGVGDQERARIRELARDARLC